MPTVTQHFGAIRIVERSPNVVTKSISITLPGPDKLLTLDAGAPDTVFLGSGTGQLATLQDVVDWLATRLPEAVIAIMPMHAADDDATQLQLTSQMIEATPGAGFVMLDGEKPCPVIEKIAEVIEARLMTANSALEDDDDENQMIQVVRPRRVPDFEPRNLTVILDQVDDPIEDPENDVDGDPPGKAFWQPFTITCVAVMSDDSTVPATTVVNLLMAEMKEAVTRPTNWHAFRGNAINARFGAPIFGPDEAAEFSTGALTLEVQYRTAETSDFARY